MLLRKEPKTCIKITLNQASTLLFVVLVLSLHAYHTNIKEIEEPGQSTVPR